MKKALEVGFWVVIGILTMITTYGAGINRGIEAAEVRDSEYIRLLEQHRDASQIMNITRELFNRGYSQEDIQKIWGGNLLRVFRQVALYAGR